MNYYLSVLLTTRFDREILTNVLHLHDPEPWVQKHVTRIAQVLNTHAQTNLNVMKTPEGRFARIVANGQPTNDEETLMLLQAWTQTVVREIGHLPFLFYILIDNRTNPINPELVDDWVYQLGGPLFLIHEDIWKKSRTLQSKFNAGTIVPFLNQSLAMVIREPEKVWWEKTRKKRERILSARRRNPMEEVPTLANLPPNLQSERMQLDNLVNLPSPRERKYSKPEKSSIHLQKTEKPEDVSLHAYQDVPAGGDSGGARQIGGRALLVSCNMDVNLIQGWKPGDPNFDIHNARALHFTPSVKEGSLPEAISTGRVILKNATIKGNYKAAAYPTRRKPNRMIWPQQNLPNNQSRDGDS